MKKIFLFFSITLAFSLANVSLAQSNDVLNQGNKKTDGRWNSQSEEVISKKKSKQNQNNINNNSNVNNNDFRAKEDEFDTESNVVILNSCEEDLTVEFVSLIGYKASQEVYITIRYTNHDINKTMRIRDFKAYNEDGDFFTTYLYDADDAMTDIPIKRRWEVGKMLPSKNSKLTLVSFTMNSECTIEMRNVLIEWK